MPTNLSRRVEGSAVNLAYCEIDEQRLIGRLVVNRPDVLNALNVDTAQAIQRAAAELSSRADLRCIVLQGRGRAFMAGSDLSAFAEDFDRAGDVVNALLDALEPVIHCFREHPAPVVASVQGAVAGAGLSLMAACDLVIAAEGTRFMLAYDKIAAPPDCGGSYFLPRAVGQRRANALMYLGESWDAQRAEQFGLINQVVAADRLADVTDAMAQKIANGPSRAYAQFKTLVSESRSDLQIQLDAEREAFVSATRTQDFKAGVSAFLSREAADFIGK
ncbi:enoyl-CoA hydratase/isomerase family protein [Spongiibacter nanhainus]|uniref:Enoyl-CoA hydratase/isomerase family protein n=1 Tax=Spongiibacter nanhainus TaxID=2794344 RepID=A0A7T4R2K1_9GAMM|nr:enoyl-CoA hydratase-related protein [Spongiibacter nanhainus]QQD19142.1 enoyl-CoA hydratase/isomerase family protein [Spongiibacter nanhainus]